MRITHVFKDTSKQAQIMRWEFNYYSLYRTIYDAYTRPSQAKIDSFESIKRDYKSNEGMHIVELQGKSTLLQYNDDLRVTGASSHFYSTIASFYAPKTGETWLIKETHVNTYVCKL